MVAVVDDDLRRVDAFAAQRAGIIILSLGALLGAERVLLVEIVPVVDMIAKSDGIVTLRQFTEHLVGRRT